MKRKKLNEFQKQCARNKYYIRKYGITLNQYQEKLESQEHNCALCGKHRSHFKRNLAVDHNHKTGQVRGLVCFYCNKRKIGRNDLESATRLHDYMVKFEKK